LVTPQPSKTLPVRWSLFASAYAALGDDLPSIAVAGEELVRHFKGEGLLSRAVDRRVDLGSEIELECIAGSPEDL
jgi:hypothetical protein